MTGAPGGQAAVRLDTATKLAYERTFLAHERTQMAWVRTGLSLISFGFTIAKFFDLLHEKLREGAPPLSPRAVGVVMIAIGLVALLLAGVQHRLAMKRLHQGDPDLPTSLAGPVGFLLGLLGILALIGALLR